MMKKQFIAFIAIALIALFNFVCPVYAQPTHGPVDRPNIENPRPLAVQVENTITYRNHKTMCIEFDRNGCQVGVLCQGQNQHELVSILLPDFLNIHGFTGEIEIEIPGDDFNTFDIDIGVDFNPCRCSGGHCYCYSDRRLKRNIHKIGQLENGLNVYTFNYIWDSALTVGVMADEVRKVKPEAVININGFDLVDYSEILK